MAEQGEALSDRELVVLERLADGSTNREIARDLDISPNTVKVHLRNIFTKLGVSSRTEATTVALQKGLVSVPGIEVNAPGLEAGQPTGPSPQQEPSEAGGSQSVAIPAPVPLGRWRLIGVLSLMALGLLLGLLAITWLLRGNGVNATETEGPASTGEPFDERPMGTSNWLVSRPMPTGRANMALTAVGLDLYQIGGDVDAGVVNLVEIYETDSRQWHSASSKPTAVADAAASVLFGEIYVPGGRLADGRPTSVVEAYSPANNAWRPVAPLPRPIAGGLALSEGGLLYLVGGWDGEGYLDSIYQYNPGTDSWRALPSLKKGRAYAAGGVLANRLYIVGGYDGQDELASCETFDLEESVWSDCPEMLLPRGGASATVLGNNLLYVLGGGITGKVPYGEYYDAHTNSWQRVDMPMLGDADAWHNLGVTNVETRIYALGGRRNGRILSDNYVYAPLIHQTFLPSVGGD